MKKKFILWTSDIDNLISKHENNFTVGGIKVQMYMWEVTLVQNGWKVYSFTSKKKNRNKTTENIEFLYYPIIKYINPLLSLFFAFYYVALLRPQVILLNGATRDLLIVSLISRLFGIKTIEMFASDSDLEPGKELIDSLHDKLFFRLGLRITDNFIVQNTKQADLLKANYNKTNPLLIPLIWIEKTNEELEVVKKETILWVSNFRKLKRPEWFLRLAQDKPEYKFVMVGNSLDRELFEKCKGLALKIPNIDFLGGLSFTETNILFKSARLFICTSEVEGFPNTFLQAWMNECPILTTFDPSDLIKDLQLGIYCESYEDICMGFEKFEDKEFFKLVQSNIRVYYKNAFSAQMQYEKLINRFMIS
jgi:glycosyltransferase involved in cell wall biosynthesis